MFWSTRRAIAPALACCSPSSSGDWRSIPWRSAPNSSRCSGETILTMLPIEIRQRLADALQNSWFAKARPNQIPPPGEWSLWMLLAGGGFGKRGFCPRWPITGQEIAPPFETHAYARETGIMYGNNQADERAARRLRWVW